MDITPLIKAGSSVIQGYGVGFFKISGRRYDSAILILPGGIEPWDFSGALPMAGIEAFRQIADHADALDLVIIGSGARITPLPPAVKKTFSDLGIAVDVMESGAACRTYNVLLAEGRRIAAALIPL